MLCASLFPDPSSLQDTQSQSVSIKADADDHGIKLESGGERVATRSIQQMARLRKFLACCLTLALSTAQTYSNCDPLTSSECPADSALGKSVTIDFTQGASESFTTQGNPTYNSSGVAFTISESGDAPQLTSKWYIMFGKVDVVLKAAPGAGIVSSFVLQSDDLDEIDWEWLGADSTEVQTNYFGKGQTTTYNRGAFQSDPDNQSGFKQYTLEWTSQQITWYIDGTPIRTLTPSTAETNQYPQTPMMIKVGAWSGGDPSNAEGTIEWARGPTNYADGPFTMMVSSIAVTDYSTGTSYSYSGESGSWTDIESSGGTIYGGGPILSSTSAPAVTSTATGAPMPFEGTHKTDTIVTTPTVYPWVPLTSSSDPASVAYTNYPGLPSGWTVNSHGKVVPPNSAPTLNVPCRMILAVVASVAAGFLLSWRV